MRCDDHPHLERLTDETFDVWYHCRHEANPTKPCLILDVSDNRDGAPGAIRDFLRKSNVQHVFVTGAGEDSAVSPVWKPAAYVLYRALRRGIRRAQTETPTLIRSNQHELPLMPPNLGEILEGQDKFPT